MRILLIRLSALGDVVTGLHVLASLKRGLPEASIGWLVEDRFASLLEGHPQLDRIHVYKRGFYGRCSIRPWRWGHFARFVKDLRRARYDVALDLQGNFKSGVLTCLSGARRRWGLGPPLGREGNGLFVRRRIEPPGGHRMNAYLALVAAAVQDVPRTHGFLPAHASDARAIVLHPGASKFGAFKRWPPEHFAALADRLARRTGAPVVLTAGPGERAQAEKVLKHMECDASIAEPPTLSDLTDLLAGARLVVAGDTGPAHLAAVVGAPTVTLFGPKDPSSLAPVGPRTRVARSGVRCSPCDLRFCPDPVCMSALSVECVEREALELLETVE